MTSATPDHYDVLGVPPDASAKDIEEAYRRLASLYAPERGGASERLAQLQAAYSVLSDGQLRALYDMRREALSGMPRPKPSVWPAGAVARKPWGIPAILLVLIIPLFLWGSALVLTITRGAPENISDAELITSLLLNVLILDGIFVVGPAFVVFLRHHLRWDALGFRPLDQEFWWVPPVIAATAFVATFIYLVVLSAFGATAEQDIDELFDSRIVLPVAGFATVIVAPLAEELFFRGFVFAGLIRPFGAVPAMLASGLLFATFHATDGSSALLIPPFAAIGFGFAWAYYRTGSLWSSIGAHFIFNAVSFGLQTAATWRG